MKLNLKFACYDDNISSNNIKFVKYIKTEMHAVISLI